jgi:hypothetical protein
MRLWTLGAIKTHWWRNGSLGSQLRGHCHHFERQETCEQSTGYSRVLNSYFLLIQDGVATLGLSNDLN